MYIIFFRANIEELHITSAEYVITTDIYRNVFLSTYKQFFRPKAQTVIIKEEKTFNNKEK